MTLLHQARLKSPQARPRGTQVPSQNSLRKNIAWTFVGNVVYAACQWLILVVLARMGTTATVGQFALALAITTPVIMLTSLQLRWVQATDSGGEFDFRDCLVLRLLSTLLALFLAVMVGVLFGYDRTTIGIVAALATAKGIEAICDVFYGWYQQHERMELISYSLMIRGPLSVAAVALGFWWTHSLLFACISLAAAWALTLFVYDVPWAIHFGRDVVHLPLFPRLHWRKLQAIFVRALPVGLTAGVIALQINTPRFFVEQEFGEAQLGIFAAMAFVLRAAETFVRAVNQSAMPRLSRHLRENDLRSFRAVLRKLIGLGAAGGLTAVLLSMLCGRLFLQHVYGAEYAESPGVLTLLVVGMAVAFALLPAEVGLRSMRRFWTILGIHAAGLPLFIGLTWWWVPQYGLWGAAFALLAQAAWHGTATTTACYLLQRTAACGYVKDKPTVTPAVPPSPYHPAHLLPAPLGDSPF